jgi:hypothetical protein
MINTYVRRLGLRIRARVGPPEEKEEGYEPPNYEKSEELS